ncbi:MAG: hypothetical protein P8J87_09700, partial [Verrucomicrobiales bacterium]|nr:hypothetical protein [Verrucomicrobiales bacterium]
VSENIFWARDHGAPAAEQNALAAHLIAVRHGIGAEKSPAEYGAFPSDPYSHTPENAGVKQPGMTGQVKEDVLARFAEIGVHIHDGQLGFRLDLFDHSERLASPGELTYFELDGTPTSVHVPAGSFAFTLAQVPVTYQAGEQNTVRVRLKDGTTEAIEGNTLSHKLSQQLFSRSGTIQSITCHFIAFQS